MSEANEVTSTALLEACGQIVDITGSCPADSKGWEHPESCEAHCEHGCEVECWKTYFISLSSNAIGEARADNATSPKSPTQ